jgi:replicative DNA helicase
MAMGKDNREETLRVPPHSDTAEQGVLGAILLDPTCLPVVADILKPEDFYNEQRRAIYKAALDLMNAMEPANADTILTELEIHGLLEKVGGRKHLALLSQAVATSGSVTYHAGVVRENASRRQLISALGSGTELAFDPEREFEDVVGEVQNLVYNVADHQTESGAVAAADIAGGLWERINERRDRPGSSDGLGSGFWALDELTGGFHGGELTILAARPSMGKTALMLDIVRENAIRHSIPTLVFTMEMDQDLLVERMFSAEAKVDSRRMKQGQLTDNELLKISTAMTAVASSPIYIDDSSMLDEMTMFTRCRRMVRDAGIGLVVVDYLQLMHSAKATRDHNRVQEVSNISRTLKAISRDLKIPVLALSQLSRDLEKRPNKRPILSDLRESGSLEQDADNVIFIYRDEYYTKEKSEHKGEAEINVAKQRNGPIGVTYLEFNATTTTFASRMARPRVFREERQDVAYRRDLDD